MTEKVALDALSYGTTKVDSTGLFEYHYPIQVPPGIGADNQPKISLDYRQDAPNGVVGLGWSIGGLSSISRSDPLLMDALVSKDTMPDDFRYSIDGQQLYNVSGQYAKDGTVYRTAIDSRRTVKAVGDGFVVTDDTGRVYEYGIYWANRITARGSKTIVRWLLDRAIDLQGNYIMYTYTTHSDPGLSGSFRTTPYPDKIFWTFNDKTKHDAPFQMTFIYEPRPDVLRSTAIGGLDVTSERLNAITMSMRRGKNSYPVRTYMLRYQASSYSKLSMLADITVQGTDKLRLPPLTFAYPDRSSQTGQPFRVDRDHSLVLKESSRNYQIIPTNVSGRGLTDIALLQEDPTTGKAVVRTYLASAAPDVMHIAKPVMSWAESKGPGGVAPLNVPVVTPIAKVMSGSLSRNGRADLVLPYVTNQGSGGIGDLYFSMLKSVATGYNDAKIVNANCKASLAASEFLLTDLDGDGKQDIVQVHNGGNGILNFRTFYSAGEIMSSGTVTAQSVVEATTAEPYGDTASWTPIRIKRSNANALLRVFWAAKDPNNSKYRPILRATTYAPDGPRFSRGALKLVSTTNLDEISYGGSTDDRAQVEVHCFDANNDGVQDIVISRTKSTPKDQNTYKMNFSFKTYLSDGQGGFVLPPIENVFDIEVPKSQQHWWHVTSIDGSSAPQLSRVFAVWNSGDIKSLNFPCRPDGSIEYASMVDVCKGSDTDGDNLVGVQSADLTGSSIGELLVIKNRKLGQGQYYQYVATPVYSSINYKTDLLTTIVDPLGLKTEIDYRPLTSPVYASKIPWDYLDQDYQFVKQMPVISSKAYVTSHIAVTDSGVTNAFGGSQLHKSWLYEDASISLEGQGWLGFGTISCSRSDNSTTMREEFYQEWPRIGVHKAMHLVKGLRHDNPSAGHDGRGPKPAIFYPPQETLESKKMEYTADSVTVDNKNVSIVRVLPQNVTTLGYDNSGVPVQKQAHRWQYDSYGNVVQEAQESSNADDKETKVVLSKYTTINGLNRYLVATRTTQAVGSQQDWDKFYDGDLKLERYQYDTDGSLMWHDEWSTSTSSFLRKSYSRDKFGNVVRVEDAGAGLVTDFVYDTEFCTYEVSRVSKPSATANDGFAFEIKEHSVFDARWGKEISHLDGSGRLICTELDSFGRKTRSWMNATQQGEKGSVGAMGVTDQVAAVPSTEIWQVINTTSVVPCDDISYVLHDDGSVIRKSTKHFSSASDGMDTLYEVFDRFGRNRKTIRQHGPDGADQVACQHIDYDLEGREILKSNPTLFLTWQDALRWQPDPGLCARTTYDALGRQIESWGPRDDTKNPRTHSTSIYSNAGTTNTSVLATVAGEGGQLQSTDKITETTVVTTRLFGNEPKPIKIIDTQGKVIDLRYDPIGRLVSTKTSNEKGVEGIVEEYAYDSMDNIVRRSTKSHLSLNQPIVARTYNSKGCLESETQTGGTDLKTVFTYDSLGRLRTRTGCDGRVSRFDYPSNGTQQQLMTAASISTKNDPNKTESKYTYTYDSRGRLIKKDTQIFDSFKSDILTERYTYDWQDRIFNRYFPDGTWSTKDYKGSQTQGASLCVSETDRICSAKFGSYTALGKPESWSLDIKVGKRDIPYRWKTVYNSKGAPVNYHMERTDQHGNNETLRDASYQYNPIGQLSNVTEKDSSTNLTTNTVYQYQYRRLVNTNIGNISQPNRYDDEGNLVQKGLVNLETTSKSIVVSSDRGKFAYYFDSFGRLERKEKLHSIGGSGPQVTDEKVGDLLKITSYDGFSRMSEVQTDNGIGKLNLQTDAFGRQLARYEPNGDRRVYLGADCEVTTPKSGPAGLVQRLIANGTILATVVQQANSTGGGLNKFVSTYAVDHKGSLNATFIERDAGSNQLGSGFQHDAWGDYHGPIKALHDSGEQSFVADNNGATYEMKEFDNSTELLNFGDRYYDPLIGRFTTPDDIDLLPTALMTDGLNRHVFELNDPVNHVDPSGHVTEDAWIAFGVSAALLVVGLAITLGTGGVGTGLAASIGWGALGGFFMGAGTAGLGYMYANRDKSGSNFWKGWGWNVGIGGGIGAVSGAFSSWVSHDEIAFEMFQTARFQQANTAKTDLQAAANAWNSVFRDTVMAKAVMGATTSAANKVLDNVGQDVINNRNDNVLDGVWLAALEGAAFSLPGSIGGFGYQHLGGRKVVNQLRIELGGFGRIGRIIQRRWLATTGNVRRRFGGNMFQRVLEDDPDLKMDLLMNEVTENLLNRRWTAYVPRDSGYVSLP